jgi:hypothetical protein
MKRILLAASLVLGVGLAGAKLPPPDDAAKAKAAETAAKAAWQAKVDGYQLCKVQDKIAAQYRKTSARTGAPATKPDAPMPVAAAAPAASGASAATPAASGTPVAAAPPPPCQDPGPFAYNPPEQKPLETSGAHSPSGTAASPPSVKPNSAEMAPAKK